MTKILRTNTGPTLHWDVGQGPHKNGQSITLKYDYLKAKEETKPIGMRSVLYRVH